MLNQEELKNLKADKVIDARGTACPGPLLAAKRSLAEVSVGGIMEIMSSDEGTTKDIPKWANKMGHEFLGIVEEAGYWRIFMKKMK
jgi:TusA-related sulfurtransferase